MSYHQTRSYSAPSLSSRLSTSSLHSQYSSSSERSLSCSPGPSTPCDILSRSPSFSHERPHKPLMTAPMKHIMSAPFSPVLPQPKGYSSHSSQYHNHHHHPYVSIPHPSISRQQQYHGQALPSPRDVFSPSPRDHAYDHHESQYHTRGDRSSYGGSGDYFSRPTSSYNNHPHPPTPITPPAMESSSARVHPLSPGPMTPLQASTKPMQPSPYDSPRSVTSRVAMMDDDYFRPMSRSPSISSDRSSFSLESSPFPSEQSYMGMERSGLASPAMSSLSVSLSINNFSSSSLASTSSGSSNAQLLLCPVCSRAFKPSKNQNCNLRRHLKNVHNMSPAIHPRKCKWDSLPDGRVKDDKDRKERTRKSKRLWARKFRLRRKVEEAAVVLSMLGQTL
ncbi:hypothetical protein BGZ46_000226 [Entomortierella lignicola]|nr:hypothetical protein BGZ46_000226 [Entomortierella lignicola]